MSYYGYLSTPSNRADWIDTCLVIDDDTGDPIDLSTTTITMTVTNRRRNPNAYYGQGYFYDPPVYLDAISLKGSTETGEIIVVDLGTFQWTFPAMRMNGLPQGEYVIGIRLNQGGQIAQAAIGVITVMEGIDMQ
jgi:hypothetical protein